ncbi:MAG: 5-(carboxyamino)imidazole ribonucleotide mutase [candidate division NC10 bacterium]|nr:5-(carboxyamino)imidazole ribonucleotide mutase [candidate division NC10 bacterium]
MGSDSDLPVMEEASKVLETFGIPYELRICSAHRSPALLTKYLKETEKRGLKVFIAGAGGAAHLPGVIAAQTSLPVIGIPLDSTPLKGIDALLSIAQMPGGVPVATMAIGRAGARNAAILAAQILALSDETLEEALFQYKKELAAQVADKDRQLSERRTVPS